MKIAKHHLKMSFLYSSINGYFGETLPVSFESGILLTLEWHRSPSYPHIPSLLHPCPSPSTDLTDSSANNKRRILMFQAN
jgi:hypothetical protein